VIRAGLFYGHLGLGLSVELVDEDPILGARDVLPCLKTFERALDGIPAFAHVFCQPVPREPRAESERTTATRPVRPVQEMVEHSDLGERHSLVMVKHAIAHLRVSKLTVFI
jgi:hypothetical protein